VCHKFAYTYKTDEDHNFCHDFVHCQPCYIAWLSRFGLHRPNAVVALLLCSFDRVGDRCQGSCLARSAMGKWRGGGKSCMLMINTVTNGKRTFWDSIEVHCCVVLGTVCLVCQWVGVGGNSYCSFFVKRYRLSGITLTSPFGYCQRSRAR
jgi:hypothetical protein